MFTVDEYGPKYGQKVSSPANLELVVMSTELADLQGREQIEDKIERSYLNKNANEIIIPVTEGTLSKRGKLTIYVMFAMYTEKDNKQSGTKLSGRELWSKVFKKTF